MCLVAVCIDLPRRWDTASSRSLTELLQLRLRLGEQLAHRLDPRAQFDDALVGELRRRGVLGRELCRGGSAAGARCRPTKIGEPGNGQADDQAERRRGGRFP